jgi:hypothetical protein
LASIDARSHGVIERSSRITRAEGTVHRGLAEGGGVLLNLESGAYYSVNSIGLLIWDLIADGRTFDDIVNQLRARVSDPPDDLHVDVRQYLEQLEQRGLIEVGGGGSA